MSAQEVLAQIDWAKLPPETKIEIIEAMGFTRGDWHGHNCSIDVLRSCDCGFVPWSQPDDLDAYDKAQAGLSTPSVRDLIERSSLGTAGARKLRARTPADVTQRVPQRAAELQKASHVDDDADNDPRRQGGT